MKHPVYYWTLVGWCFLLVACHSEEDIQSSATVLSLHTAITSYSTSPRAIDDKGFDGIIKKEFVPQDQITVFTDQGTAQEKSYTATLQKNGTDWKWESGNPLLLASGTDENSITATYTSSNHTDELITSSCRLENSKITLHFIHRKALLSLKLWGNIQGPISDLKLYDEKHTEYKVTEGMVLIPPEVTLCQVSFLQQQKEQTVKFEPLQPLDSNTSYLLNIHLDQTSEEGEPTIDLTVNPITPWINEGAYFNGKWYARDHIIASEEDLNTLRSKVNDNNTYFKDEEIILITDLNFGGYKAWDSGIKQFDGTFLGNGHTIHNLFINITANKNLWYSSEGFISNLSKGGTIDNLHFKDCGINTQSINDRYQYYSGILTGSNRGIITRCSITNGNLRGPRNSSDYMPGAIAGANYGDIIACHAKADMEIVINGAGGLIGANFSGTLFGCYYDGQIYSWSEGGGYNIGVLIGYSRDPYSDRNTTIRSCYGIKQTGSYEGRLLGKPHNYIDSNYDKIEDLESNCLLIVDTTEGSKEALIKDASDITDANSLVWKAEKIWNEDLTINFDYHGEP